MSDKNIIAEYNRAIQKYDYGEYNSAKDILLNLIKKSGKDFNLFNLLAAINSSQGDINSAINNYQKALELNSRNKNIILNLANCYKTQDNPEKAIELYKLLITYYPNDFDGYNCLGIMYSMNKETELAEENYKKAISLEPNNPSVYSNYANLFQNTGNFNAAINYYQHSVELDSDNYEVYNNIGSLFQSINCYSFALSNYFRSCEKYPNFIAGLNNAGTVYMSLLDFDSALLCYFTSLYMYSIDINKKENPIFSSLDKKIIDELNTFTDDICKEKSLYSEVKNFSAIKKLLGRFKKAKASELVPDIQKTEGLLALIINNIGAAFSEKAEYERSFKYYYQSLVLNPHSPEIHHNLGMDLLRYGKFKEGWKEYEYRKIRTDVGIKQPPNEKLLIDQDVKGKRILVFDEQGIGDSLQFCRYLIMLKKLGAYIIYECWSSLLELYKGLEGYDEIIARNKEKENEIEYDYHIPLLSLPLYFKTDISNVPGTTPYLKVDSFYTEKWKKIINGSKLKVGLVWEGNPGHKRDKLRSMPIQFLNEIKDIEGIDYYIIQKEARQEQISEFSKIFINLNDYDYVTYCDTAGILSCLDLIITVDTSVAHLAGALRRKVWLLLSKVPDFRWMTELDTSPWYPEMKLYRQDEIKVWDSVISRIKDDLINESTGIKTTSKITVLNKKILSGDFFYLGLCRNNYGYSNINELILGANHHKIKDLQKVEETVIYDSRIPGLLVGLNGKSFTEIQPANSDSKIGFVSFDHELETIPESLFDYKVIITTSNWCKSKLIEKKLKNVVVIGEAYNSDVFRYSEVSKNNNYFAVYSDGEFGIKQGSDILVKAISALQQKFPDIIFINSWSIEQNSFYNPVHLNTKDSKKENQIIQEYIISNGCDPARIISTGKITQLKKYEILSKVNIGAYLNRCSATNNYALLETLASGIPAIYSDIGGHKDIIYNDSMKISSSGKFQIKNSNGKVVALWDDISIDEIISKMEYFYLNRDNISNVGKSNLNNLISHCYKSIRQEFITHLIN